MTAKSPYALPDGNVQICFSGGRTSAFMLHQILEANGDLPERAIVTFQNTGREMPETFDFVQQCGERFGVRIIWLEYKADRPFFDVVSHNSASRDGEPFEALIRKKRYLPNQQQRFCTSELKVKSAKRYLVSLGWKEWTNTVGIRADEQHRIKPEDDKMKDRWYTWQPLNHANVSRRDVVDFWDRQDFDLKLPNLNGQCWLGNCDGCFLKSEASIASLAREYPERAKWWEDMESMTSNLTSGSAAHWSKRYTRKSVRAFVEKQGDWIFDDKEYLCQKDEGECTG